MITVLAFSDYAPSDTFRRCTTPWCNGSTTGFGPVSSGSNPGGVISFEHGVLIRSVTAESVLRNSFSFRLTFSLGCRLDLLQRDDLVT